MNAAVVPSRRAAAEALSQRLAPARAWWTQLPARERRLVAVAAAVVALFLLWTLAIRPAWQTVRGAPAQIDALDAQLQTMQRMAGEVRELRAAPSVGAAQSVAALQAASARLGERARLVVQADRAVLTLSGVSNESLRNWLGEARTGARARPIDAQLARGPQGLTGSVTVSIGAAP